MDACILFNIAVCVFGLVVCYCEHFYMIYSEKKEIREGAKDFGMWCFLGGMVAVFLVLAFTDARMDVE